MKLMGGASDEEAGRDSEEEEVEVTTLLRL